MSTKIGAMPTMPTLPAGWPPEMWIRLCIFSMTSSLVSGFGAYDDLYIVHARSYMAVELAVLGAALMMTPRGTIRSIFIPIPLAAFVTWWFLSYTWSAFPAGFQGATAPDIANIVVVVTLASVLPIGYYIRTLIHSGYIALALIFVALAVQPNKAYSPSGSLVPGLHGGFGHKNAMAPCLIILVAAVLCFDQRRRSRLVLCSVVWGLLFFGKTSTGLATMLLVVGLNIVLRHYDRARRALGRAFGLITIGSVVIFIVVSSFLLATIVTLDGKDLTFSSRSQIWSSVWKAIKAQPLIGYGWGGVFVDQSSEPTISINRPLGFVVYHSHDAALELVLRLGVVGLVLYLCVLWPTIMAGVRLLKAGNPTGRFILLVAGIIVMFGLPEVLTVFGTWLGLTAAFGIIARRLENMRGDDDSGRATSQDVVMILPRTVFGIPKGRMKERPT